jgi:hypothetical protein
MGDFEAISYCWESEVRDTDVFVDNTVVQVPANLEALLQHLQNLPEARSGMAFWIDGLCIDQSNVLEKNHQVGLMKRIYSRAFSVITWLGPGNEESDMAAEAMCQMSIAKPDAGAYKISSTTWMTILDVWERNYFGRMWILQELALNRSSPLFMCGRWQIPRASIEYTCAQAMEASMTIARTLAPIDFQGKNPDILNQTYVWERAYNVSRVCSLQSSDYLEKKLDLARRAKVKDARDKVYGLRSTRYTTRPSRRLHRTRLLEEYRRRVSRICHPNATW